MPAPRIVDLTLPLTPGQSGVAMEPKNTVARDGWNVAIWHLYSHAGTHRDSQLHFGAGPETIHQAARKMSRTRDGRESRPACAARPPHRRAPRCGRE